MKRCLTCGNALSTVPGPGPVAVYCSTRCRVAAHRARHRAPKAVPRAMRDLDRWVRHSVKVPKTPDGRPASVSDPATWSSWREASASKVGEGLGFVLGDGIGGLDLDRVLSRGGVLLPAARRLLDALPRTYVEVSPSRTGLHVLGLMPPGRGRVVDFEGVKVEVYPSGRYLTVTGDRFGGAPPRLADLGAQVAMLLAG